MPNGDFAELVDHIRRSGCISRATSFDEASVVRCVELDIPVRKLASSDINDWVLIERIATAQRPASPGLAPANRPFLTPSEIPARTAPARPVHR
jgi:sialic acid synthase SpsE